MKEGSGSLIVVFGELFQSVKGSLYLELSKKTKEDLNATASKYFSLSGTCRTYRGMTVKVRSERNVKILLIGDRRKEIREETVLRMSEYLIKVCEVPVAVLLAPKIEGRRAEDICDAIRSADLENWETFIVAQEPRFPNLNLLFRGLKKNGLSFRYVNSFPASMERRRSGKVASKA